MKVEMKQDFRAAIAADVQVMCGQCKQPAERNHDCRTAPVEEIEYVRIRPNRWGV